MATFMERIVFLQKVPTLMKATADDENPCPGYLFQEIGKIPHESSGCSQCLLEFLLERLQVESCRVKLKVLKIFIHLCSHGSDQFLTELRRNSTFIQQASVHSGPPDPIHGTELYQKVRNTAQEVARLLFTDTISIKGDITSAGLVPTTMGMGSGTVHRSGLQGFGYSPGGSDSLLEKIQKAAEVVASAVLPPAEQQGIRLHENHYRAVAAPSAPIELATPACAYNLPSGRTKVLTQRCPGQVGGGWEETDSSTSSHNSSQDITSNSRTSVGSQNQSAGSGSQSEASRESGGDASERVDALQLGDCGQEMALISKLTEGTKVFLTREESQHFLKECSILNCEVVLELLSSKLQDPSDTVKMRVLCAVSCLLTSDLLSLEQILGAMQRRLHKLSEGLPGPVANKATKILRQVEALMGGCQRGSNSQQKTTNQLSASAESSSSAQSANNGNLNHVHADVSQHQHLPSALAALALDQRCSPDLLTDGECEDSFHIQQELERNQSEPDRTSGVEMVDKLSDLTNCSSPPVELQGEMPQMSKLSLFSGMELVSKGISVCIRETDVTKDNSSEVTAVPKSISGSGSTMNTSHCNSVLTNSSQPSSAFSFVNF
ncbi:AP-4 complex accessory subunit Tepsin [Takifugu rubripes]|uniref:TEPSIN adaptor related protein complex 4 accessory protein n=1 Tax=Takifugu rubripes TaxID=31033 RepID=H2V0R5_TAKRU|nr:AP-4 complex accessory subunit tepsin [Takifugu rubripes]|eukprot:XP_011602540.1 PREDICTED: AP-4 complex accessory subunit tepsin [Takifugu rubripes]